MTKAPRAGDVKTRLVPPLTHNEAAQLNTSFLRDTATAICAAAADSARCVGVYTPVGTEHTYGDILPLNFALIPQRGDSFGERLYFAAEDLFACGFESVCLIDSDSPTIPAETFSQAVKLLQGAEDRVVLGPSDDGGYYLIGLKKLHSEMFERIEWSTERVLEQTLRRAVEINVEVKMLSPGYDVDDRAGLQRLCRELLGENSPLHPGIAPHTREFLSRIIEREGRARIWSAE
jgi:rSAM/selenodomain-associated transferase 1